MNETTGQASGERADAAHEMRMRWLTTPAAEWGVAPTDECPTVYGVLMEWKIEDVAVTVVGFCDGSASVYHSRGGGIIGGHGHEDVRRRAVALVKSAARFYAEAVPAAAFPYPDAGRVTFYLLGFGGVRVLTAHRAALEDGRNRYREPYEHGWAVFARLFAISEQQADPGGESGGDRKEWYGPRGYVNCLLTAMSSGASRSITLSAGQSVPDLVRLAEGNDELQSWLRAQEFPYASMQGSDIIDVLRGLNEESGVLSFMPRRAEFRAVHVTEDRHVANVYDLEFSLFNRSATVSIAPRTDPRVAAFQRQTDARVARAEAER